MSRTTKSIPCCWCHGTGVIHDAVVVEMGEIYDPSTHVCVSREAAIALLMNVRGLDDANFAAAELRAALEVGK